MLLTLFPVSTCMAQPDLAPLEADRPDRTESPAIVPAGWVQCESGWERRAIGADAVLALPAVLFKPGLTERLELRFIVDRTVAQVGGGRSSGMEALEVGAKAALCSEKAWRPRTSVIAHVAIPGTAAPAFRPQGPAGNIRFTLQHTLSRRLSLGYNLGAEWENGSLTNGIWTTTVGMSAGNRWGFFGEVYGSQGADGAADHWTDAGVTFRMGSHVLLDTSFGTSLRGDGAWFVGAGLSFRVPVRVPR